MLTPVLVFVHILLMVFWIGTDLGVFIAGFFFMDERLALPQRRTAIELGLVIDRIPRLCFPPILPVGVQIAHDEGLIAIGPGELGLVWAAGLVWLLAVLVAMLRQGHAGGRAAHRVERLFHWAGVALVGGLGAAGLLRFDVMPQWLAGKLVAFAVVCALIAPLEAFFSGALAAFQEVVTGSPAQAAEHRLRRDMWRTYGCVVGIYVAVLVAAFLGVAKP